MDFSGGRTDPVGRWWGTLATTRTRSRRRGSPTRSGDAELLADAIDDAFVGRLPFEYALASYERKRNAAAMPLYQMTCDLAKLEPPPPEIQSLFAALRDDEEETGRFIGTIAGTVPISEFYSPENMRRLTGAVGLAM
jgi:hypothetical protein